MTYDLVVVGGGAAGFFAAINTAVFNPRAKIIIIEKSSRVLQKVKISGGGRCNVTNRISIPTELSTNYPRGEDFLTNPFEEFTTTDTIAWFEKRGVKLKTEKDGRIFPVSNSSQTIIDCFLTACETHKIEVLTSTEIKSFEFNRGEWQSQGSLQTFRSTNLVIATGSSPAFWRELTRQKFEITSAVPSLFTFTTDNQELTALQGISIPDGTVSIKHTTFQQKNPVLITHWGFSGPAILKLSATAARYLHEKNYQFTLLINWLGIPAEQLLAELKKLSEKQPKKNIIAHNPFRLPSRLWKYLCEKSGIRPYQNWAECGTKTFTRLTTTLCEDPQEIIGKSTYKDEFVTAGGLKLDAINPRTFQHKELPNLFFAGEVLDIDGFTGGFNFQAAWTAGYIIAKNVGFVK